MLYLNFLNYSVLQLLLLILLPQIILENGHKTYTVHMPDVLGEHERHPEYIRGRPHSSGIYRFLIRTDLPVRVPADKRNHTPFISEPDLYFTGIFYRYHATLHRPVR